MKTVLLFLFAISTAFAQTKLISHKSHSGSSENFAKAISANLFDISDSNLGNPPAYHTEVHIDSIIYVSENKAVMVKTSYKIPSGFESNVKDTLKLGTVRQNIDNKTFRKGAAPDSIKAAAVKKLSPFRVKSDKTIVTGFETKKSKKSFIPIVLNLNWPKWSVLLLIATLSLLLGKSAFNLKKAESKWPA